MLSKEEQAMIKKHMAFPCIFMINDANGDAHTESLKGALALVLRKETSDVDAWRQKFSRLVGFTVPVE